jgi:hypothetical protein
MTRPESPLVSYFIQQPEFAFHRILASTIWWTTLADRSPDRLAHPYVIHTSPTQRHNSAKYYNEWGLQAPVLLPLPPRPTVLLPLQLRQEWSPSQASGLSDDCLFVPDSWNFRLWYTWRSCKDMKSGEDGNLLLLQSSSSSILGLRWESSSQVRFLFVRRNLVLIICFPIRPEMLQDHLYVAFIISAKRHYHQSIQ